MSDETKHTAGPWVVREYPTGSSLHKEPWREIDGSGNASVVSPHGYQRTREGETETYYGVCISAANAALISAAPDLLDVALEAAHRLAGHTNSADMHTRKRLLAAIARATTPAKAP